MGKVWVDTTQVGTFDPQTEGISGDVLLDSTIIGTFTLAVSGYVYVDATQVGTYRAKQLVVTPLQAKSNLKVGIAKGYIS